MCPLLAPFSLARNPDGKLTKYACGPRFFKNTSILNGPVGLSDSKMYVEKLACVCGESLGVEMTVRYLQNNTRVKQKMNQKSNR